MKIACALLLCLLGACAGLIPRASSTSSSDDRASGADTSGQVTIPDVFKLPRAQAIAALRKAGVQGDINEDGNLCGSTVNGRIVETGEVCQQQPVAGRVQGARLVVTLTIQTEDPRHGDIGRITEWRLMPNLVGKTFDQALAAMRSAGFTDDSQLQQTWADETSCKPNVVCRQYPEPMKRAGLHDGKAVYLGADAKPVVASVSPAPAPTGGAPPSPPIGPGSPTAAPTAQPTKHWGGDGSPARRDADNRPRGPGGPVFMGRDEACTDKHDHCLRPGVLFAADNVIAGKLFRGTPVFELEGKWWTWLGQPATYKLLLATKVTDKIGDFVVGKPIVFLSQESAHELWLDNEYEALTSSRWAVGVVEAIDKDTIRVQGWGLVPLAYARVVVEDKATKPTSPATPPPGDLF